VAKSVVHVSVEVNPDASDDDTSFIYFVFKPDYDPTPPEPTSSSSESSGSEVDENSQFGTLKNDKPLLKVVKCEMTFNKVTRKMELNNCKDIALDDSIN
jgi:hypothetical protein